MEMLCNIKYLTWLVTQECFIHHIYKFVLFTIKQFLIYCLACGDEYYNVIQIRWQLPVISQERCDLESNQLELLI